MVAATDLELLLDNYAIIHGWHFIIIIVYKVAEGKMVRSSHPGLTGIFRDQGR